MWQVNMDNKVDTTGTVTVGGTVQYDWDWWKKPTTPHPCPSCGRCPTCGRGSYWPWNWPYGHWYVDTQPITC